MGARTDLQFPKGMARATRRFLYQYQKVLEKEGKSPLQIMIKAMVEKYDAEGAEAAFPLAEKVAPYMYGRMENIDITQEITETKRFVLSAGPPMTREQWIEIFAERDNEAQQQLVEGEAFAQETLCNA